MVPRPGHRWDAPKRSATAFRGSSVPTTSERHRLPWPGPPEEGSGIRYLPPTVAGANSRRDSTDGTK